MKAILVIDMPKTCEDCQLRNNDRCYAFDPHETLIEEFDGIEEFQTRNENCPLEPMPEEIIEKIAIRLTDIYDYEIGIDTDKQDDVGNAMEYIAKIIASIDYDDVKELENE